MIKKFLLFSIVACAMVALVPSCTEPCPADKDCGSGTCFEGDCVCDPGYEADADGACKVESRAKYFGRYKTTEQCANDPQAFTYEITIETDPSGVQKIKIFNFFDSFKSVPVVGTLDGAAVTIAEQTPVAGGSVRVKGSGTFSTANNQTVLTITYTAQDGNAVTSCNNTVFTKL